MGTLLDLIHTHYRGLEPGDLELSASVHAEDVVTEMPMGVMEGLDAFRALGRAFVTAVPDMRLTIRETWEVGDTIIVEGTYSEPRPGRSPPRTATRSRPAAARCPSPSSTSTSPATASSSPTADTGTT